jgi:hypothetical protein
MRLKEIKTAEEANTFLKEYLLHYNKRFAVKVKDKADLHRSIPRGLNLDRILCIKTDRRLRNDFTISHDKKLYQIQDTIKAEKVTVEERINGTMIITHNDVVLKYKEIATRPESNRSCVS